MDNTVTIGPGRK